jgi:hypothetical protein
MYNEHTLYICPITIKKQHFQLSHVLPPLQFATIAAAAATLDVDAATLLLPPQF